MKIEGPNKTGGAKGVSKAGAKKAGDTSFSGLVEDMEESASTQSAAAPMALGPLDALLSLQEDGGMSEEAKKRQKERAELLLNELDKVRIGILTGGIPVAALQQLTRVMGQHREKIIDPRLAEIVDEIDLRVQVELAKHGG